jgi:hypothetical protein
MVLARVDRFVIRMVASAVLLASGAMLASPAIAGEPWERWYQEYRATARVVDLANQRRAYMRSAKYDPFDRWVRRRLPALLSANQASDCRRVVSLGETIWQRHPFNARLNDLLSRCYASLATTDRAAFHDYLSRELEAVLVGQAAGDALENPLRPISACEFLNFLDKRAWRVKSFTYADSGTLYAVRYELLGRDGVGHSLWVDLTPLYQGARMDIREGAEFEIACEPGGQLLRHARLLPHNS